MSISWSHTSLLIWAATRASCVRLQFGHHRTIIADCGKYARALAAVPLDRREEEPNISLPDARCHFSAASSISKP